MLHLLLVPPLSSFHPHRSCPSLLPPSSLPPPFPWLRLHFVNFMRVIPPSLPSPLQGALNSGLALPVDEVAAGATDSIGELVDRRLYGGFWGLQAVFQVCVCVCVC